MKQQNNLKCTMGQKGITLITLVITIIILLILVGVTISLTIGEHGLFNTAKNAALKTKIAEIEEQANISYMKRKAGEYAGGEKTTLAGVISDLKAIGYKIEEKQTGEKQIKEIVLSKTQTTMNLDETQELTYTMVYEEGTQTQYYVEIEGKYHEIKLSGGRITVDKNSKDIQTEAKTEEITVESDNENIVEAKVEEEKKKIKITSKEEIGEATITVKETNSNKIATCKITVELPTSIRAEDVSFTPDDTEWDVDNVKKALDDLFNN